MLTKFQKEFIQMFENGLTVEDVADKLWIDVDSVRKNVYRIKKKLNVTSMQEIIEITRRLRDDD